MHRRRHRRQGGRTGALGSLHPRRPDRDRARCGCVGTRSRSPRRRRNPADQHGSRRRSQRLRPWPHARGRDAVDVPVIASGGVGGLQDLVDGVLIGGADAVLAGFDFSLRRIHGRAGQGRHERRRDRDSRMMIRQRRRASPLTCSLHAFTTRRRPRESGPSGVRTKDSFRGDDEQWRIPSGAIRIWRA